MALGPSDAITVWLGYDVQLEIYLLGRDKSSPRHGELLVIRSQGCHMINGRKYRVRSVVIFVIKSSVINMLTLGPS